MSWSAGIMEMVVGSAGDQGQAVVRHNQMLQAAMDRGLVSDDDLLHAATSGYWPARILVASVVVARIEHGKKLHDRLMLWLALALVDHCNLDYRPGKASLEPVPDYIRRAVNTVIAADVDALAAALEGAERLPGDPSPREQAVEIVGKRYGLKPRQVENRLSDFREEGAPTATTTSPTPSGEVH